MPHQHDYTPRPTIIDDVLACTSTVLNQLLPLLPLLVLLLVLLLFLLADFRMRARLQAEEIIAQAEPLLVHSMVGAASADQVGSPPTPTSFQSLARHLAPA